MNLIKNQQPDLDELHKDLFESKYQLLINGRETGTAAVDLQHLKVDAAE